MEIIGDQNLLQSQNDICSTSAACRSASQQYPPAEYSRRDWLCTLRTLLPSNRSHTVARLSKAKVTSSLTLPRMQKTESNMDPVMVNLQRQLSNLSQHTRRPISSRVSRHSFRFIRRAVGIDQVDATGSLRSDPSIGGGSIESMYDEEEDRWLHLVAIRSMPICMERKRRLRRRQQQTPTPTTAGFSIWEYQKNARNKIYKFFKEIISRFYVWSPALKTIEGQYGTGVVSYFVFLRWLLFLNIIIYLIVFCLVVLPQIVSDKLDDTLADNFTTADNFELSTTNAPTGTTSTFIAITEPLKQLMPNATSSTQTNLSHGECQKFYESSIENQTEYGIHSVQDLLQGTGWMEITAMFSGWYNPLVRNMLYSNADYNLSLAYVFATLAYFLVCLVMMVIYTSESVHETLSQEGQLNKYCNLVFGGWDYCIEKEKTAKRKMQSITQELKSTLEENRRLERISNWSRKDHLKIYAIRVLLNIVVIAALGGSGYLIYFVCQVTLKLNQEGKFRRTTDDSSSNFYSLLIEFLPSITITVLNIVLPVVFTQIAKVEEYSKRFEIKITLIRTVFVRLASIGVLSWTFYNEIKCIDGSRSSDCGHCKKAGSAIIRCWETYVGQQVYKLVILDFIVVLGTTFLLDFPRKLIVSKCNCKLTKLVGLQEFDIPKHVLDLVYSQTLCWLGTFYSPLLPVVCILKYIIFFYLKKLTLLVNCSPSEIPYRASKSNTFFMGVLMLSFIVSAAPVGLSLTMVKPSKACGPFRMVYDSNIWQTVSAAVNEIESDALKRVLYFATSGGFGVLVFVILCLAIYYYTMVTAAHKKMIQVLKNQLVLEGKDKEFLLGRLREDVNKHQHFD